MHLIQHNEVKAQRPEWVQKIREIIQERYNTRLSLASLSKEAGVHPVHLSRQFPKYFNVSFYYYVRQVKVQMATQMLKDKGRTLQQVASLCGFSDPSHFNRCFRKITGLNPSEYKKRLAA